MKKKPTAKDVLLEFITDIEAVGIDVVQKEWPDLVPTFQKALDVVYDNNEEHE